MDATTSRATRTYTCDQSTAGRLAKAGAFAALSPGRRVLLLFMCAVLGLTYGHLFTWVAGVVAAIVLAGGAIWVRFAQLRKTFRTALPSGTVMTSGYDSDGRFVTASAQGANGLERGAIAAWTRSGGVVVLRLRRGSVRLLVPAELLDEQDLSFLTDQSHPHGTRTVVLPDDAPSPTAGLMPHHLTVTEDDQAALRRAAIRLWLTRSSTRMMIGLCGVLLVTGLALRSWQLVAITVVVGGVCGWSTWSVRRLIRQVYPVGSLVRAGLTDEALLLQSVVAMDKVTYPHIASAASKAGAVVIQLQNKRSVLLPGRLLPADVVVELSTRASRA